MNNKQATPVICLAEKSAWAVALARRLCLVQSIAHVCEFVQVPKQWETPLYPSIAEGAWARPLMGEFAAVAFVQCVQCRALFMKMQCIADS